MPDPNGLCFSPDYKKLYVARTGKGPGDTGPGGKGDMFVFDVGADNKLSNHKRFSDFMVDGVKCGPDGVRCDVNGNVWASSNAGRAVGYSGVTVWTPDGKLIGRIRLPEVCGNVCFGGPKRNRLFMAASQSLYAVYTGHAGRGTGLSVPRLHTSARRHSRELRTRIAPLGAGPNQTGRISPLYDEFSDVQSSKFSLREPRNDEMIIH